MKKRKLSIEQAIDKYQNKFNKLMTDMEKEPAFKNPASRKDLGIETPNYVAGIAVAMMQDIKKYLQANAKTQADKDFKKRFPFARKWVN